MKVQNHLPKKAIKNIINKFVNFQIVIRQKYIGIKQSTISFKNKRNNKGDLELISTEADSMNK